MIMGNGSERVETMRLIDAEKLDVFSFTCPKGKDMDSFIAGMGAVLDRIYEAPTVEETIRCEDCKWFDISEPSGTVEPICYKCKRKQIFVESDDFCKRGEGEKE